MPKWRTPISVPLAEKQQESSSFLHHLPHQIMSSSTPLYVCLQEVEHSDQFFTVCNYFSFKLSNQINLAKGLQNYSIHERYFVLLYLRRYGRNPDGKVMRRVSTTKPTPKGDGVMYLRMLSYNLTEKVKVPSTRHRGVFREEERLVITDWIVV